jgi:LL-H family phage holin
MVAMFNELITNVLIMVIIAVIGIVTRELIPIIRQKRAELTARLQETEWAWLADIVDAVVRAVEQTVKDELHGPDKKAIAINQIKNICQHCGIEIKYEQIDALIEAAVQEMNAEAQLQE